MFLMDKTTWVFQYMKDHNCSHWSAEHKWKESNMSVQKVDDDYRLVAFTPNDMGECQDSMVKWCHTKIVSIQDQVNDLVENIEIATRSKWTTKDC